MAVEPIEGASDGEVLVGGVGVGDVPHERVDPGAAGVEPAVGVVENLVAAAHERGGVDEVRLRKKLLAQGRGERKGEDIRHT